MPFPETLTCDGTALTGGDVRTGWMDQPPTRAGEEARLEFVGVFVTIGLSAGGRGPAEGVAPPAGRRGPPAPSPLPPWCSPGGGVWLDEPLQYPHQVFLSETQDRCR
jgi:hypothetical protein